MIMYNNVLLLIILYNSVCHRIILIWKINRIESNFIACLPKVNLENIRINLRNQNTDSTIQFII